jgi:outer membrane protein OmpA-like peptidoglycan-associated protein
MRIKSSVLSSLSLALISCGMLHAHAADAPYYNPTNAASSSGLTVGYELFKTIGCPGRGILEAPCAGPVVAQPEAVPAVVVAPKDSDGDGVIDANDRCPTTPAGRAVNAQGCELDGDGDGVVDALDKCPDHPGRPHRQCSRLRAGRRWRRRRRRTRQCPTTPTGRAVNAEGCEMDGDGDGVVDALDKCPTTPAGRTVNAEGCEPDGDGDGVVDSLDKCPTTPTGDRVDSKGCSLPTVMNLQGVNFDNNRDTLRADAINILEEAIATLKRYPALKVEIAGHTDSANSDAYNLDLSQRRANSVMNYFIGKGIEATA